MTDDSSYSFEQVSWDELGSVTVATQEDEREDSTYDDTNEQKILFDLPATFLQDAKCAFGQFAKAHNDGSDQSALGLSCTTG